MTQNSTSDARVGWVSSGPGRSTADILWSYFSVFLLCTWSCLHLNVPSVEESEAGWHKWHSIPYWPERPLMRKWGRKVGWMLVIIVAPEFGVAMAAGDFLRAKEALKESKNAIPLFNETQNEPKQLSRSHAYLSTMGGLEVKILQRSRTSQPSGDINDISTARKVACPSTKPLGDGTISQHLVNQISRADTGSIKQPGAATCGLKMDLAADIMYQGFVSSFRQLERIRSVCRQFHLPDEEDIRSLSKRDAFIKTFAIAQSTWLVIQCITRASIGLPITQLELATIAFVACGTIMYVLWWNKPYGLERRQFCFGVVDQKPNDDFFDGAWEGGDLPQENQRVLGQCRIEEPHILDLFDITRSRNIFRKRSSIQILATLPYDHIASTAIGQMAFYISGTIFSSFHILAWNWEFPSPEIRLIWRVFAIIATAVTPSSALLLLLEELLERFSHRSSIMENALVVSYLAYFALLIGYLVARLGLIVLIFYCFADMPVGVYQTVEWTKMLPHFG